MAGRSATRQFLWTGTALCTFLAAPLAAQTVDDGTYLGEIVTGFGSPRIAIDTPQSVTVLDQEDLDREIAGSIGEAIEDIPGVSIAGGQNPLGEAFNIRGIGLTEQPASEARIIVQVDGAPKFYEQYRMGSFFSDVELYRRVEVLRGPASSTLYGSGALGGVILFETKDAADFIQPGETSALRARTSYTSNGEGLMTSVILANAFGDFETLAALNWRTTDNFVDGDGVEVPSTAGESISGLVKGTWRMDGGQILRLSYQQWDSTMDDAPLAATGGTDIVPVFGTTDRDTRDQTAILSYENPFEGNDWLDLKVQLSYSDTAVTQSDHQDTSGSPFPITCSPGTFAVLCDADYSYVTTQLRVQNESTLVAAGWDTFLTYGVDLSRIDRTADSEIGALAFHPEGVDDKIGLFAQGEFVWNDRLTLIPGVRIDMTDRTPGDGIPGAEAVEDTAVSPKLAALYDIGGGVSVFGSVARTERLPTLDELYSFSDTQLPALSLDAETSLNYEIGFAGGHSDLFTTGDSLNWKVTTFQNTVDNLIQRTDPTRAVYFENIADAEFQGVELEAGYDAAWFFARVAYSTVDAQDTTYGYTLSSNPADNVVLTLGGRMQSIGLEYGVRGNFAQDITTATRSATFGTITETEYEGYQVYDVFANWKPTDGLLAGMQVDFAVENLTDETYRNNLSTDNSPGRSVKLALTYTF